MPMRRVVVDGVEWRVTPSGRITQYDRDEFGLIFTCTDGSAQRVTRVSPTASRSREQALAELSDAKLVALLAQSQSAEMSPELGYRE
jgi:YD repeat-containing protein